jgi:hypothetical protein
VATNRFVQFDIFLAGLHVPNKGSKQDWLTKNHFKSFCMPMQTYILYTCNGTRNSEPVNILRRQDYPYTNYLYILKSMFVILFFISPLRPILCGKNDIY